MNKTQVQTHTPTPWRVWHEHTGCCWIEQPLPCGDSEVIAKTEPGHLSDAAHIVCCVNAHESLVKALESALPLVEASYLDMYDKHGNDNLNTQTVFEGLEQIKQALAHAKGDEK